MSVLPVTYCLVYVLVCCLFVVFGRDYCCAYCVTSLPVYVVVICVSSSISTSVPCCYIIACIYGLLMVYMV